MSFSCNLCHSLVRLERLAELPAPCPCLICIDCAHADLGAQIQRQQQKLRGPRGPAATQTPPFVSQFKREEAVLYLNSQGVYVEAVVKVIDISVQPPQYGIQLPAAENLRFTEQDRLISTKPRVSVQPGRGAQPQQSSCLHACCPRCYVAVDLPYLRRLAPDAVAAWEEERNAEWLRANDVIACPFVGCGALIQRLPASAANRIGGTSPSPSPTRGGRGGAQRPDSAAAAGAHREQHRYRCGACKRDFCDACLSVPYHNGYTCRQARAPDCLLCGGKVDEERVPRLLPAAAAAASTERDGGHDDRGTDGAALRGSEASALTLAMVRHATRKELLGALRSLEVDTEWCLEKRDLEKAFLHWGCRTCSDTECAARRRDICSRPLPCGHWCCGLRGEGNVAPPPTLTAAPAEPQRQATMTHPRCIECGSGPRVIGSPVAAAAAAAAVTFIKECCFCWEPLHSGPCIEMACGPRHMCHLHCANARLAAGYPGPLISFAHLYCPLCRGGPGGGAGNGAAGAAAAAWGSPGPVQVALAPVHLDHPALRMALEPHLALRSEVVAAGRERLRMEAALRADPELRPGGRFDGRPADYVLEKLAFYKCGKCVKVYYGGLRACGPAVPQADVGRAQQQQAQGGEPAGGPDGDQVLMCGDCCARAAGTNCAKHGTRYIEWKCRYCCSLASWFCYGTTHMCDACHSGMARGRSFKPALGAPTDACTDPKCGLKGTPHPPPGHEACLGCGMCRAGL